MKIAIDCRYLGMSGIGRVLEGILDNLDYSLNEYYLIGKKNQLCKFDGASIIECDSNPYSFKGLIDFPRSINKKCNYLLIPNFIIPFGVKIKTISIVHDLIFLDLRESTNGKIDYMIKKSLLRRTFKKSCYILCDSNFTVNRASFHFPKYSSKCILSYPGISKSVLEFALKLSNIEIKKENKIVFVGNVKPHKGINDLLVEFRKIEDDGLVLKIIGKKDSFLTSLNCDETQLKNVVFTGKISDEELFMEIASAKYLIQPSKYEGFGLPPLEALLLRTQPIVSNIEVFKEVYS